MRFLLGIMSLAISACTASQPTKVPLAQPTIYQWMGSGPQPSAMRLAQDKYACAQEAERAESVSIGERWQTHVNLCMHTKGWDQKPVE